MYDNFSANSIPSDIHLISSAAHAMQQQQFYEQMFGSLADVVGYRPAATHHYNLPMHISERQQTRLGNGAKWSTSGTLLANQDKHPSAQYQRNHNLCQARQQTSAAATRAQQQRHYQPPTCSQRANQMTTAPAACLQAQQQQQHYLTIEELKTTRNSCWLCGCNWQEDHVSLDCPECDGYALSRPCPSCDGKCKQIWQRNISATHDKHRALWSGRCALEEPSASAALTQQTTEGDSCAREQAPMAEQRSVGTSTATSVSAGHNHCRLAPSSSSVCSSQPSSAASSDDEPDDFLSI